MSFEKPLVLYREGLGNVIYGSPPSEAGATPVTDANDGLSDVAGTAKLGQTVGAAGDPAALTEDREIPNPGGFTVFFGKNDGVSNVVGINSDQGVDISNNNGTGLTYFDGIKNFQINMPTADTIEFVFGPANTLIYSVSKKEWTFNGEVVVTGFGAGIRSPGAVAVINVTRNDFTILIDTSAGNVVVNMDPAILASMIVNYKKITSDANTITLTPASGTIMGVPPAGATFVFSNPGESIQTHCDGTNFFII